MISEKIKANRTSIQFFLSEEYVKRNQAAADMVVDINKWLSNLEDNAEIIDISYKHMIAQSSGGGSGLLSVMIVYTH